MIILRVRNRIVVLQLECIFILENGNPNELKLHLNSWDSFRLSLETGDKLDILRMSCLAKRKKNLTRNQRITYLHNFEYFVAPIRSYITL